MRKMLLWALASACLAPGIPVSAEEIANVSRRDAFAIYVSFDIDPTFAVGIGFTKDVYLDFIQRDLLFSVDASIPIFLIDLRHFEFNAAVGVRLFSLGPVSMANRLGIFAMTAANDAYSGVELGMKEAVIVGYFGEKWHLAAEMEYDMNLLAYMTQSESYRDLVYADGKDGWYAGTGGRFKLGVLAGFALSDVVSLNMRGGYTLTEQLNQYTIPFYFSLSTAYRF